MKYLLLLAWSHIPFGKLCGFRYGNLEIKVRKNLMLEISDGDSTDTLPITLVSEQLQKKVLGRMKEVGYFG